jgi:hypothetical protein
MLRALINKIPAKVGEANEIDHNISALIVMEQQGKFYAAPPVCYKLPLKYLILPHTACTLSKEGHHVYHVSG